MIESFKSSEIAEATRTQGNKLYCERNFFDALLKYNESLCFAPDESEAIGLAYANRSAVYYEMKLFRKCKENIALAKVNRYPEKNFHILDKRALKCDEEMSKGNELKENDNQYDFIKLSHDSNPKLPFVVDCLEVRKSKDFGRFIITNRDLNVGDIVAIEDPHFRVIKSDGRYESCRESNKFQRCSVCLKDNQMSLIPCPSCVSTMFCSQECMNYAERSYHNYECPLIEILLKSGVMQMAMRIFFQALNMFNGSIAELEKFLSNYKDSQASVYDFDFSHPDELERAKSYLVSAYCLARNDNEPSTDSPHNLFKLHPFLEDMWKSHEIFINKFISRILKVGDSNFHGVCGWSINKYESHEAQMIGIGCYPFISLVNHSCLPNVHRIYIDGKMFLLVERPIGLGEQLFDCYRTTFFTQSRAERQMILQTEYSFQCQCEACAKSFPLFNALKVKDQKIYKLAKKGKSEVSKLDAQGAKRRFIEFSGIIQDRFDNTCPSMEVVILQECLQQLMSVIIKPKILFS